MLVAELRYLTTEQLASSETRCINADGQRARTILLSSTGTQLGWYCQPCGRAALADRQRHEDREARRLAEVRITPTAKIDVGPRPPRPPALGRG
jgi:hypothetical protein